jgi:hypothetical protein
MSQPREEIEKRNCDPTPVRESQEGGVAHASDLNLSSGWTDALFVCNEVRQQPHERRASMLQLASSQVPQPNVPLESSLAERIRGEFREMPGLKLTLAQAGRLWSLDADTCRRVLLELVETGFLSEAPDGAFSRAKA